MTSDNTNWYYQSTVRTPFIQENENVLNSGLKGGRTHIPIIDYVKQSFKLKHDKTYGQAPAMIAHLNKYF